MFKLKNFIKKGLLDAIGKMADYQIILNAASWHEKGVLDQQDLAEIEFLLESKNMKDEAADETEDSLAETSEEIAEEVPEET